MWRLVVTCWVVSVAAFLPAVWVVGGAAGSALESLPTDDTVVPAGDVVLILAHALEGVIDPLKLAILSGVVTVWLFTVLWHAGVVNWALWAGGRRVRVGEVLGLGMVSWWRYARLSLTAAVLGLGTTVALWVPLSGAVVGSYAAMAELRVLVLLFLGIGVSKLLWLVFWATTLRGAWLLGLPERRSAVLAWLRGLVDTVRAPVWSLGTVLLWAVPAVMLSLVPLLLGLWAPALRGGWVLPLVGQLAAAVRSFCWVGLFASFAPVTGLVGPAIEGSDDDRDTVSRGPQ
jgi:hypothetical protein